MLPPVLRQLGRLSGSGDSLPHRVDPVSGFGLLEGEFVVKDPWSPLAVVLANVVLGAVVPLGFAEPRGERNPAEPNGLHSRDPRGDPWSKQEEIARDVATEPQVCVVSANGVGEGWLVARLALWFVYGRRGRVLMTAPTLRQGVGGFMEDLRRAFVEASDLPGELLRQEFRIFREEVAGLF